MIAERLLLTSAGTPAADVAFGTLEVISSAGQIDGGELSVETFERLRKLEQGNVVLIRDIHTLWIVAFMLLINQSINQSVIHSFIYTCSDFIDLFICLRLPRSGQ